MEYISGSAAQTIEIGTKIAELADSGSVIALFGGMGAGKTCLTTGIARALGFDGEVSSPTFAVVNEYVGGRLPIAHFDMYRVTDWNDLYSTGFFDYMDNGYVLIVEWSENIESALDNNAIRVRLDHVNENTRKITLEEV